MEKLHEKQAKIGARIISSFLEIKFAHKRKKEEECEKRRELIQTKHAIEDLLLSIGLHLHFSHALNTISTQCHSRHSSHDDTGGHITNVTYVLLPSALFARSFYTTTECVHFCYMSIDSFHIDFES